MSEYYACLVRIKKYFINSEPIIYFYKFWIALFRESIKVFLFLLPRSTLVYLAKIGYADRIKRKIEFKGTVAQTHFGIYARTNFPIEVNAVKNPLI